MTPVVHINPRFDPPNWESTGTIDDVVAVAQAAERFGYDWVACSEHIAIPMAATNVRGPRYWDPHHHVSRLRGRQHGSASPCC